MNMSLSTMSMSGRGCVALGREEKDGTDEEGIFFADGGRDIRGTRGPKKKCNLCEEKFLIRE